MKRTNSSCDSQDLHLFEAFAARCAASMKSRYADMRDCHSASLALSEVLADRGYADAAVIGCSVITGRRGKMSALVGKVEISKKAAHSVVLVRGCLIDATAGQFRSPHVQIPDYIVLPDWAALPMLERNRRWMETDGGVELEINSLKSGGTDFSIAYIPTDPCFAPSLSEMSKVADRSV